MDLQLRPIGRVESALLDRELAPRQADEGAPAAWLVFDPSVADAVADLEPGTDVLLVTWLDRANRDVLRNHPRSDRTRTPRSVFVTRSPDRPNPIGLHEVRVRAVDGLRVGVEHLEAIDGTPIIDVKSVLGPVDGR